MNQIVIIQYSPIENYPPVMNLLNDISANDLKNNYYINVITTKSPVSDHFQPSEKGIHIHRFGTMTQSSHSITRYLGYLKFYFNATKFLLKNKPSKVLYYDTLASLPVLLYKKFSKKKFEIYTHYHEYISPQELSIGMKLNKWLSKLEKKLLQQANWVSHTNQYRLSLFEKDYRLKKEILHVLPNYPPASFIQRKKEWNCLPVKFVYVGSFNSKTMYIKEFAHWIASQNNTEWHVYPIEISNSDKEFFESLNCSRIIFHKTVTYFRLSEALHRYDIGLILYKGHSPNYVFNETNKLYEYLACGLQVWYSNKMLAIDTATKELKLQNVWQIDFEHIEEENKTVKPYIKNDFTHTSFKANRQLIKRLLT